MIITTHLPGRGPCRIKISDGLIQSVEPAGTETDAANALYCSPGLVDLQINGFAGVDFSAAELDATMIARVLPALWATGCTSFCPTLMTNSIEHLERNFRIMEVARGTVAGFADSVPCYHLEGPYLSAGASHGAHDPRWMHDPDWDEFQRLQDAAGGRIGLVTLAPERDGALPFIGKATAAGVVVALSHTDGNPADIHAAAAAGATLNTHLGNGCPSLLHRHFAPFWAQLANSQLTAGIICDGFHLTPEMVQIILQQKGLPGCMLVTDAVHVAGLPAGRYELIGQPIELLPSGQVVTADGRAMAGSTLAMNQAVTNFRRMTGVSLAEALLPATRSPAHMLHRYPLCAEVKPGAPANLTLFRLGPDHSLLIEQTLLRGHNVYTRTS